MTSRLRQAYLNCFLDVLRAADGDMAIAARVFDDLADVARSASRKPKGPHDPKFDRELLLAYASAPKGQRVRRIREIADTHKKTETAAKMRLSRLLKKRTQEQKEQEALVEAMAEALSRGDQQTARDIFCDHLGKQRGSPLPAEWRTGANLSFEEINALMFGNK